MPRLQRINIYPVKSLPGHALAEARVLASGALEHDRRWALVDGGGQFITAKKTARIHLLRARYADDLASVTLAVAGKSGKRTFALDGTRAELAKWLSDFFGLSLTVAENTTGGFPDDTELPGPTVVSVATLAAVAAWFPGIEIDEVRQRFRANLEIDGVEPFWEDRLVSAADCAVPFRVGDVSFDGMNPCQRCVVPTRNPSTGDVIAEFAKRFSKAREAALPAWAERSRFDHFYRLSVNTRMPVGSQGGVVRVGDAVRVLSV